MIDLTDNTTILDYYLDSSTSSKNTSKLTFGGRIQRNPNSIENPKRGVSYKFNITRHIRNLVKNADATNIKLGVVVTEDINIATSYKVLTPTDILKAPAASVMNPLGTILYGNNTTDENKRIKFQIYYTKPKPN